MTDWTAHAACVGLWDLMDVGTYHGADPTPGEAQQIAVAKDICSECPVLAQCAEWVAGTEGDPVPVAGVVAGLTERERRLMWGTPSENDWRSTDRMRRLPDVLEATRVGRTAEQIAADLGVDERTVFRARADLKQAGLLTAPAAPPSAYSASVDAKRQHRRRRARAVTPDGDTQPVDTEVAS
jgi:hypothetical protein